MKKNEQRKKGVEYELQKPFAKPFLFYLEYFTIIFSQGKHMFQPSCLYFFSLKKFFFGSVFIYKAT